MPKQRYIPQQAQVRKRNELVSQVLLHKPINAFPFQRPFIEGLQ